MTMSLKSAQAPPLYLGEFELLILLAVLRLGGDAYGVTIRDELEKETSREVTVGAIYKTLGRLQGKGYVSARVGDPTPQRGGRRKKLYRLEPLGSRAVKQSCADLRRLTRGLGRALEAL
jgi:PadR family transcriptional regulator, regulatory protein PadR